MHVVVIWCKVAITALEYVCEGRIHACLSVDTLLTYPNTLQAHIPKFRKTIQASLDYHLYHLNQGPGLLVYFYPIRAVLVSSKLQWSFLLWKWSGLGFILGIQRKVIHSQSLWKLQEILVAVDLERVAPVLNVMGIKMATAIAL
jgi:hypothetical protein